MSTDLGRVEGMVEKLISEISAIRQTDLPAINLHLTALNGTVRHNTDDVRELKDWRKGLSCAAHATSIELLRAANATHEVELGKNRKNWALTINTVLSILNAIVVGVLLWMITGGS
jgi:hypothetical protein